MTDSFFSEDFLDTLLRVVDVVLISLNVRRPETGPDNTAQGVRSHIAVQMARNFMVPPPLP